MNNGILLDLEMNLYFGRLSVKFSLEVSLFLFSYEKPLFIHDSMVFNLEFSLSIY